MFTNPTKDLWNSYKMTSLFFVTGLTKTPHPRLTCKPYLVHLLVVFNLLQMQNDSGSCAFGLQASCIGNSWTTNKSVMHQSSVASVLTNGLNSYGFRIFQLQSNNKAHHRVELCIYWHVSLTHNKMWRKWWCSVCTSMNHVEKDIFFFFNKFG